MSRTFFNYFNSTQSSNTPNIQTPRKNTPNIKPQPVEKTILKKSNAVILSPSSLCFNYITAHLLSQGKKEFIYSL